MEMDWVQGRYQSLFELDGTPWMFEKNAIQHFKATTNMLTSVYATIVVVDNSFCSSIDGSHPSSANEWLPGAASMQSLNTYFDNHLTDDDLRGSTPSTCIHGAGEILGHQHQQLNYSHRHRYPLHHQAALAACSFAPLSLNNPLTLQYSASVAADYYYQYYKFDKAHQRVMGLAV